MISSLFFLSKYQVFEICEHPDNKDSNCLTLMGPWCHPQMPASPITVQLEPVYLPPSPGSSCEHWSLRNLCALCALEALLTCQNCHVRPVQPCGFITKLWKMTHFPQFFQQVKENLAACSSLPRVFC